jgi:hypothetical protein
MTEETLDRPRGFVKDWAEFVAGKQPRHLVFGSTTSVLYWRQKGIRRLLDALNPAGRFAFKRDLDDARGRYVLLVAFEQEEDAKAFAHTLGAEPAADYAGFASERCFAFDGGAIKKIRAALKRLGATKRLLPH